MKRGLIVLSMLAACPSLGQGASLEEALAVPDQINKAAERNLIAIPAGCFGYTMVEKVELVDDQWDENPRMELLLHEDRDIYSMIYREEGLKPVVLSIEERKVGKCQASESEYFPYTVRTELKAAAVNRNAELGLLTPYAEKEEWPLLDFRYHRYYMDKDCKEFSHPMLWQEIDGKTHMSFHIP